LPKTGIRSLLDGVLFERSFGHGKQSSPAVSFLQIGSRCVPLWVARNARARRYVLRLRADGSARVTVPRGGSLSFAREFAARHSAWLERQLERLGAQPREPVAWQIGTEILVRGELVCIEAVEPNGIRFGSERLRIADLAMNLRPVIEGHLRALATRELPPRVLVLAAQQGLVVRRITVRNQRTRWGSCSRRGTISLNWRLIQSPPFVQDYICLHEILHLREMNHSARFWREVERVCPEFDRAERWLKQHATLLQ